MSGYPRPSRATAVPLRELAARTGAWISPSGPAAAAVAVTGVTHDSGTVRPGDLYAAMPGERCHGAQFVVDAARAGARAVLTDEPGAALHAAEPVAPDLPLLIVEDVRAVLGDVASAVYADPSARLAVIGITGTAGKTSSAYLVESGLRAAGHVTCLVGTVQTRIGDTVIDSELTTPESTDLHALLAAAADGGATAAVVEVSSHALTYGRVDGVRFRVGAWTNFGQDHLDFHPDLAAYFAAKSRLFDGRCRSEVLNLDDPAVRTLLRPGRVSFSAAGDPAADWRAVEVRGEGYASRFTALGPGGVAVPARVELPGRHNVANALLAIACLVELGVDPTTAVGGVAACPGVPGRLERVAAPGPVIGVVDYAHKPDAIVAALSALREFAGHRLVCVLGAGGDRDRGKRSLMGVAAAREADVVIVTDDNPRSEDPAEIRADVRAGAAAAGAARVLEVTGRRDAIAAAVRLAQPGDVVAVLGKGHERAQQIGGVTIPFDDRIELATALAQRFAPVGDVVGGWDNSHGADAEGVTLP